MERVLIENNMEDDEKQATKAKTIIAMAEAKFEFYLDQFGTAYAWPKAAGSKRVILLESKGFKRALVRDFYDKYNDTVGDNAVNIAISLLASRAINERPLSVRCAWTDGTLKIDQCNGSILEVSVEGWKSAIPDAPSFRDYPHMKEFSVLRPSSPIIIRKFIRFFHLDEQEDEVLLAGYIGTAFLDIPHVILIPYGPPGATKTTFSKAVRYVVDPSAIPAFSPSDRHEDFILQLAHNYMPTFDNVNFLKPWQVDTLCRAATGEGFLKRALYTDEDELIFSFKRPLVINGVDFPSHRGDLLDRALPIKLARVIEQLRKEDRLVQIWLQQVTPLVRGAALQGLSGAFKVVNRVREEHKRKPRMADFAIWGEAFCRSIGFEKDQFWNRYADSISSSSTTVLENDIIAQLVIKLMAEQTEGFTHERVWEGTMSSLLTAIIKVNKEIDYVTPRELPSSPESLGMKLRGVEANLMDADIRIIWPKSHKTGRTLQIVQQLSPLSPQEKINDEMDIKSGGQLGGQLGDRSKPVPSGGTATKTNLSPNLSSSKGSDETKSGGQGDRGDSLMQNISTSPAGIPNPNILDHQVNTQSPEQPEQGSTDQEQALGNKSRSFKCGRCDFETSNRVEFLSHVEQHGDDNEVKET